MSDTMRRNIVLASVLAQAVFALCMWRAGYGFIGVIFGCFVLETVVGRFTGRLP